LEASFPFNANPQGERKMKSIKALGAALLALSFATGSAPAMPQAPVPDGNGLVTNVQVDCHADVRRHYLPEYGRRVWHRHRQSNCRVVIIDREDDYDDRPRDCHRDVRRHYLPEYGRSVYHKHVGERCRIRVYYPYDNGGGGRNCIRLGIVTLCED
jgi:hypothetical protein